MDDQAPPRSIRPQGLAAIAWLVRYATLGNVPPWAQPLWLHWSDQGQYLASATAFAHGNLAASAHWYPLGYPLLATPLAWILPGNPFFLLDLCLFLLACSAFRKVALHLRIAVWPATGCFLAATLVQPDLANAWINPWTTTLSAALIWWLIASTITPDKVEGKQARTRRLLMAGALAAGLPLVRPLDVLVSVACLLSIGVALLRRQCFSAGAVLAVCAGGAAVGGVYAALHLAIYGPHPTAYMVLGARIGFIWRDLGWKAYVLLVDARPWYPDTDSILERLPWILPGCAGLLAATTTGPPQERAVLALLVVAILPVSMVMLTYADLQPTGLWHFGNIHYFKWTMPAFGLGLLLYWRLLRAPGGKPVLAAALVMLSLPLSIRIRPQAVDERTPARMVSFKGGKYRNRDEAYSSPAKIRDSKGRMLNVLDFRQLSEASGIRAISISRPFGSHIRYDDPADPGSGVDRSPYARFGEKISIL